MFREGLGGFGAKNRVQFRRRFREALVQSQDMFNRGSGEGLGGFGAEPGQVQQEKVPEKFPGGFGAALGRVQQGSGEGSGEGLGGFGAGPGQVQQGSGEGSGQSSGEALVQSQVKFNRVPERFQ